MKVFVVSAGRLKMKGWAPADVYEQLQLEQQEGYVGPVASPNPMVKVHGPGPEGARCKTCIHLLRYRQGRYMKCELRGDLTHGAATDQRARWSACGKYENYKKVP